MTLERGHAIVQYYRGNAIYPLRSGSARTTVNCHLILESFVEAPSLLEMQVIPRPAPFVITSSGHGTMIVNRNDYQMVSETSGYGVGFQILNTSYFDPDEVGVLLSALKLRNEMFGAGVVAIDCGANIGVHTIEWSRTMHGWGSVIAFEAQERVYYALAGNIAINNCLNASALNAAVGSSCGEISIPSLNYLIPSSFGSLELRQSQRNEYIGQAVDYSGQNLKPVKLVSLDSLQLARVDLIKIDVEGMEMDVLQGAKASITAHRPILCVESIKVNAAALKEWLAGEGYQCFDWGINVFAVHKSDPCLQKVLTGHMA